MLFLLRTELQEMTIASCRQAHTAPCSFAVAGVSQGATCWKSSRTFALTRTRKVRRFRTFANTVTLRRQASESRDFAGNVCNPYNIPPLAVTVEALRQQTDRLASFLGVIAVLFLIYRSRVQITAWLTTQIYILDVPGWLALLTAAFTVAAWFQKCWDKFWGQQQRRLICFDVIPVMASDVATLRKDVETLRKDVGTLTVDMSKVKGDLEEIKQLLGRPWFKF